MAISIGAAAVIAAGSIAAGALSAKGASDAGASSKQSAREQMTFQEWMSSTAHQRQMLDLEKAGLNPILSARYGGASSASGAQPAVIPNIAGKFSSSALSAAQTIQQLNKMDADINLVNESTETTRLLGERHRTEMSKNQTAATLMHQQAKLNQISQVLEAYKIPGAHNEATLSETLGPMYQGFRNLVGPAGQMMRSLGIGKILGNRAPTGVLKIPLKGAGGRRTGERAVRKAIK